MPWVKERGPKWNSSLWQVQNTRDSPRPLINSLDLTSFVNQAGIENWMITSTTNGEPFDERRSSRHAVVVGDGWM